jgi:hypothetical protein
LPSALARWLLLEKSTSGLDGKNQKVIIRRFTPFVLALFKLKSAAYFGRSCPPPSISLIIVHAAAAPVTSLYLFGDTAHVPIVTAQTEIPWQ